MPIKVSCQCGQAFNAPDKLAGKTVKCPKCQNPLAIPGGGQPQAPQQAPKQQAPKQQAPRQQAPPAADPLGGGMGSLFDDAGLGVQSGPPVCPSCQQTMMATSMVCVNCGFNRQTGARMQGAGGPVEEIDHAEALIAKARAEIDKTPISKKGSDFGDTSSIGAWIMPLFLPFFFCVSFALVLFWGGMLSPYMFAAKEKVMDDNQPQWLIPILFYVTGISLFALGWFFNSLTALDKHPVHGLIALFTMGFYSTIFGYMYFRECRKGMLCVFIGYYILTLAVVSSQTINLSANLAEAGKNGTIHQEAASSGDPEKVALSNAITRMWFYMPQMWFAHILSTITWICAVMLTLRAFDDDWIHGFIALFTGLYAFIYGFINFRTCKFPAIIGVVALFLLFVNFIGIIAWNFGAVWHFHPGSLIPLKEKEPPVAHRRPSSPAELSCIGSGRRNTARQTAVSRAVADAVQQYTPGRIV